MFSGGVLRDYQMDGFKWLKVSADFVFKFLNKLNTIAALETHDHQTCND
jgi:hypothetical protein